MDNFLIQILLAIIIIMSCYICLQQFRYFKYKNQLIVKGGPEEGDTLKSDIMVEDYWGNKAKLVSKIHNENALILFLEYNCSHCTQILKSLDLYKTEEFKDVYFIIVKSEEYYNNDKLNLEKYNSQILIMEKDILANEFNIRMFPMYIQTDKDCRVLKKGYASTSTVIEYFI